MPLVDVPVNAGTVPPAQMVREVPKLKLGVRIGPTVTVNVTCGAQDPAIGVNV